MKTKSKLVSVTCIAALACLRSSDGLGQRKEVRFASAGGLGIACSGRSRLTGRKSAKGDSVPWKDLGRRSERQDV